MVSAIHHEGKHLLKALVSPPEREYFNAENLKMHNMLERADENLAKEQHRNLRQALKLAGVEVIEVKELPKHPNSVFIMDSSVSLGDSFIRLRMGLESRRGEEQWIAEKLLSLGLEEIGKINEPGTAEGGDLIPSYPIFFIGESRRTNLEGANQVKRIAESFGYETKIIPVPDIHLHLGGAMSIIGEERILACKTIPKEYFKGLEVVYVNCRTFITGNVIYLGNEKVILEKRNVEVMKKLDSFEYKLIPLNLSEFMKGFGGPSCLILPLLRG